MAWELLNGMWLQMPTLNQGVAHLRGGGRPGEFVTDTGSCEGAFFSFFAGYQVLRHIPKTYNRLIKGLKG